MPKEYVYTGSLWQCDGCNRVWRCTTPGAIGTAWESVSKYAPVRKLMDLLNALVNKLDWGY